MNLVIVESPTKAKTVEKFLGPEYKVLASFGHIKDLPEKEFGVEIKDNFKPVYLILPKAKKVISFLKKQAQSAKKIILATDYDREGEAIAFHISEVLQPAIKDKKINILRITFTEITQEAILEAIKNPRDIDLNLVNAQQARRVLDRIVGYKLSPFLWKKVASGLSAGRVQSAALKLIVEREKEIENFVPQEYWTIIATLSTSNNNYFDAILVEKGNKQIDRLSIKNESDANKLLDKLKNCEYRVIEIKKDEKKIYPPPPFITSSLQQEAFKKFGFSAKKTMFLAQQLYEKGLITYHRTDSTNLSSLALNSIRKYIKENYGKNYLPAFGRVYKTKVLKAQEAHEAIRPTYIDSKKMGFKLEGDEKKIYDLIFRRTIACQMKEMVLDTQEARIKAGDFGFRASGQKIKFDGFSKIYPVSIQERPLPELFIGEVLKLIRLKKEQHFTQPPSRYTEATLIKELEKEGIGRPSTYAVILSTLKERGYVASTRQYLYPKDIGKAVSDLLSLHFPKIVDLKFTAEMEEELDQIAEGKKSYQEVCEDFWEPFYKNLQEKEREIEKKDITQEETEEICEKCGGKMIIKLSKFGKFLSCSNFPKCKNKKPYLKSYGRCPKCKKGEVIERRTKKGKIFWGCSRYPKCQWGTWDFQDLRPKD